MKKRRFFAFSAAANKGIDYFWQIASTIRGEKIFDQFGNLRLNKLVKKTRKKLTNRQQLETTQAYLRLDSHYKRQKELDILRMKCQSISLKQ